MKTFIFAVIAAFFGLSLVAQSSVNLRLNLEKGKEYKIKSVGHSNVLRSVNGQQVNINVNSSSFTSYKPLSQEKDVMFIETKFDTIDYIITHPGGKIEIFYAKPAKSSDYIGQIRNRLCAFKLITKISTSGKFIGFANYKTYKDSVLAVMESVPATRRDEVQKQADALLKESVLQSMVEPLFSYLPEKPVNIGDKWESSYIQASDQANMMMFNTFTLNNTENGQASITGSSQIESLPSNEPVKAGGPQTSLDAKGTSTSELTVDIASGLILNGLIKSHIEGTMNVKNQGNEMNIPMSIDSQLEISKVE